MSASSQPSFVAWHPLHDFTFVREPENLTHGPLLSSDSRVEGNIGHTANFLMRNPATYIHPTEHSVLPLSHVPHLWHANQVTSASTSTRGNRHAQWGPRSWTLPDAWKNNLSDFPTTLVNGTDRNDMTSASDPTCDPHLWGINWDNPNGTFDHSRTLVSDSPNTCLPPTLVEAEICDPGNHSLDGPSAFQSLLFPFQEMFSHDPNGQNNQSNIADTFFRHHFASPPSSSPPSLPCQPSRPASVSLEPICRFHLPAPQDLTIPFRRRRVFRAIEYDGLWVDEEELCKSLMEPSGRLSVHQCRWEEDRNPCYLSIKGEKSFINAHIQKWHGGKPGGEKRRVKCHWSTCRKMMQKESISRHIVSTHLEEKWSCQACGKVFTRNDTYWQHVAKSDLEACGTASPLILCSADARVINARAALDSGGSLRHADE